MVAMPGRHLSPFERAQLFSQNTRLWRQVYPSVTKKPGEKFRIPITKVNLLSKIRLLVEQTLVATHAASTTYTPADQSPYTTLESLKLAANLTYTPWETSGLGAFMLMLFRNNPGPLAPVYGTAAAANVDKRRWAYQGNVSAAGAGATNSIVTMYDMPIAINDRDTQGLIMAQNERTNLTLEGKVADISALYATGLAGYTFANGAGDVTITPLVETYTIPPDENAVPDLSVIKTVQEQTTLLAPGDVFKLPIGPTYRRIAWQLTDATGAVVDDSQLTGDVQLKLQTNDSPIIIPGKMLQRIYQEQTGGILPRGMWGLDFTYQGLMNYGGMRDLLDTDDSTEVWLQVKSNAALNLRVVYEGLDVMGG